MHYLATEGKIQANYSHTSNYKSFIIETKCPHEAVGRVVTLLTLGRVVRVVPFMKLVLVSVGIPLKKCLIKMLC